MLSEVVFEDGFEWVEVMLSSGSFDPDAVDPEGDEFLASLPAEAWDPPDPDDALLDPPLQLGTAAATDEAVTRLRNTARWSRAAEARRFDALLLAMDAILTEHDQAGDPVLTASILTRGFLIEAGACLQVDPRTAGNLLETARTARVLLPLTWAAFRHGECNWRSMETVYRESVGLDREHLAGFDQHAAGRVGSSTPGRLARELTRFRERLQADTFIQRARTAARARHVSVAPLRDGQAMLSLTGPSVEIATIYDGLTRAAVTAHEHPDEDRHLGALRYDSAVDLLLTGLQSDPRADDHPDLQHGSQSARSGEYLRVPHRRAVNPTCLIVLPARSVTGASTEPADVVGYGPIDIHTAMRHAADTGYWTRMFTDPATGTLTGLDRHAERIPTAWRTWLALRDGTCRAPGCARAASTCDIDHTTRREHHGPTSIDNLAHLCRTDHQIKDEGCWDVTLHPDGTQRWHSIWGTTHTTPPHVLIGLPSAATAPPGDAEEDDCPF